MNGTGYSNDYILHRGQTGVSMHVLPLASRMAAPLFRPHHFLYFLITANSASMQDCELRQPSPHAL